MAICFEGMHIEVVSAVFHDGNPFGGGRYDDPHEKRLNAVSTRQPGIECAIRHPDSTEFYPKVKRARSTFAAAAT